MTVAPGRYTDVEMALNTLVGRTRVCAWSASRVPRPSGQITRDPRRPVAGRVQHKPSSRQPSHASYDWLLQEGHKSRDARSSAGGWPGTPGPETNFRRDRRVCGRGAVVKAMASTNLCPAPAPAARGDGCRQRGCGNDPVAGPVPRLLQGAMSRGRTIAISCNTGGRPPRRRGGPFYTIGLCLVTKAIDVE
jgi:hypothetical protein